MRSLIFSTFIFLSLAITAGAEVMAKEKAEDSQWGTFKIDVEDLGESTNHLEMKITLLCKNQRNSGNRPKTVNVLKEPIHFCAFGGKDYDPNTGILTVRYAVAGFVAGDAPCEDQKPLTFNIKKLCAKWAP